MKLRQIVSNALILCILVSGLSSCTDSEQQAAIDRKARIEQREAAEAQAKADAEQKQANAIAASASDAAANPAPVETPEAPPEPSKHTVYHFTSNSEHNYIKCNDEGEVENCGVQFKDCDGDSAYYCQTGVHLFTTRELDN